MGLWSWITGIDLDAEQRRSAELQAWQDQLDAQTLARGRWDVGAQAQHQANLVKEAQGGYGGDYHAQVKDEFKAGARDGLKNMQDWVKKLLNDLAGGILGFIPWWVWLLAGGYVAWRLGLLDGIFKKRS